MLQLRAEQMQLFRAAATERDAQRLIAALAHAFPAQYRALGNDGMRAVVDLGFERAECHGLETEQEQYLYLTLMMMFGAFFDEDPQYPWVPSTLVGTEDMGTLERVLALHEYASDYLDRVAGPNNEHLAAAFLRIRYFDPASLEAAGPADIEDRVVHALAALFPEKAAAQGMENIAVLVERAHRRARELQIGTPRGTWLCATLMFILGNGFDRDPQFPWLTAILEQDLEPAKRLAELHRCALAMLDSGLRANSNAAAAS